MKIDKLLLISVFLVGFLFVPAFATSSSSDGSNNYQHPYPTNVIPGDIAIGHTTDSTIDAIIPGYWTHTGIIGWWDSSINDWIVIEEYNPVKLTPLREFMKRYDTVGILRVNTNNNVRENAVWFAYQQLGKPYNYEWYTKHVYGDKYYCSELVWAAYKANGVDIDANPGWSWTYLDGVAPQEIWDDGDTYAVYYDSE